MKILVIHVIHLILKQSKPKQKKTSLGDQQTLLKKP